MEKLSIYLYKEVADQYNLLSFLVYSFF